MHLYLYIEKEINDYREEVYVKLKSVQSFSGLLLTKSTIWVSLYNNRCA